MLLEDGDRAVTRQSAGQTGYDGAVQLGAVGRDATGATTASSAGGSGREAICLNGGKRKKKRKNPNRKKGGSTQTGRNERQRRL